MPDGLRRAICSFVVATAYKRQTLPPSEVYSFLAHICHTKVNQQSLAGRIGRFFVDIARNLSGTRSPAKKALAEKWLQEAWNELLKTAHKMPSLDALMPTIKQMLRHADTQIINADNPNKEPDYRPGMNVLVGGNRLGRGVTIKGLMTTYYGRDAKQKMVDTVHQHARMFGYRRPLLDTTRLFTASHILGAFKMIHEANEAMLAAVSDPSNLHPVWVGQSLSPTRANVLNTSQIGAIRKGLLFPREPLFRKADTQAFTAKIEDLLKDHTDPDEYYTEPLEFLGKLIDLMPGKSNSVFNWDYERTGEILRAFAKSPFNMKNGLLNVRRGSGKGSEGLGITWKEPQVLDFYNGNWANRGRTVNPKVPILIVMKQRGDKDKATGKWDDVPFYVPTLLLPEDKPYVFMFKLGHDSV